MATEAICKKIIVYRGDIVKIGVDVIINAANPSLLGGGGVDGAIHRAAGSDLLEECKKLQGCPIGEAKITNAYKLPAAKIIHTVGPIWQGGTAGEAELLRSCYQKSLQLAAENQLRTIAFPAISTGAYGYPKEQAAQIACCTILEFLTENPDVIAKVYLVAFDGQSETLYKKILAEQLS